VGAFGVRPENGGGPAINSSARGVRVNSPQFDGTVLSRPDSAAPADRTEFTSGDRRTASVFVCPSVGRDYSTPICFASRGWPAGPPPSAGESPQRKADLRRAIRIHYRPRPRPSASHPSISMALRRPGSSLWLCSLSDCTDVPNGGIRWRWCMKVRTTTRAACRPGEKTAMYYDRTPRRPQFGGSDLGQTSPPEASRSWPPPPAVSSRVGDAAVGSAFCALPGLATPRPTHRHQMRRRRDASIRLNDWKRKRVPRQRPHSGRATTLSRLSIVCELAALTRPPHGCSAPRTG